MRTSFLEACRLLEMEQQELDREVEVMAEKMVAEEQQGEHVEGFDQADQAPDNPEEKMQELKEAVAQFHELPQGVVVPDGAVLGKLGKPSWTSTSPAVALVWFLRLPAS
ncbi:unnamed protein product [Polarella glacialis]|uniref:Uncharacterized protein n=1 Tax=Polarella glacialis TaxID=89957 RepID=A0A813LD52_POLGL|nr:unnamed protein product [Polarella glacialis]